MPKDFAQFCSAIRTRSEPITYEQLLIILQSEEQGMAENLDSFSHSLAMFASGNRNSNSPQSQPHHHGGSNRGRGRNNGNRGRGGGRFNGSGGGPHQFYSPQGGGGSPHQFYTPQPQQNYNSTQTSQFGGQTFKNERPTCQIFGKAGHIAVDCYHRMDFAY